MKTMKILNFLKKETKNVAKSTMQKLEKNQLEKVIGGNMGDPIPGVDVALEQNSKQTIRKK